VQRPIFVFYFTFFLSPVTKPVVSRRKEGHRVFPKDEEKKSAKKTTQAQWYKSISKGERKVDSEPLHAN
jgi:hypothetical protein